MRIALSHLRHAHAGGTERYLNYLATFLAEAGHAVDILCRTHEETPHPAVRMLPFRPWALGRGHRLWRFARDVERHCARTDYDAVYGLGRTWCQDIIRLGGGTWALYLERAMPAERPRWQRLLGRDAIADRVALAIERRALGPGGTPLVVCNSRQIANEVQARYGTSADRIRVIHNAVDTARFDPQRHLAAGAAQRAAWGWNVSHVVLLFLGSNYQRKGLDRVLAGFATVAAELPQARLAVVGYDGDTARWLRLASSLGLSDRVRIVGGSRAVEACYAAADAYVLPTRYDPFANTTLEALAMGLPVITTTGNGGCEVLQESCGSVLDWRDDPVGMIGALRRWLAPGAARAAHAAARAVAQANAVELGMRRSLAVLEEAAVRRREARDGAGHR